MATRRNNQKWLWWGTGILIVVAIAAIGVLIVKKNIDSSDGDGSDVSGQIQNQDKKDEKNVGTKTEEESNKKIEKKEEVKQYEGESPNASETLTGVISYAGVSGENLMVRVNIDQYLAGGNCKLTLIKDGAVIYNSVVGIESSVSTSTCEGFNVPVAEIGGGDFRIEVTLESDGKYGKMVGEVKI